MEDKAKPSCSYTNDTNANTKNENANTNQVEDLKSKYYSKESLSYIEDLTKSVFELPDIDSKSLALSRIRERTAEIYDYYLELQENEKDCFREEINRRDCIFLNKSLFGKKKGIAFCHNFPPAVDASAYVAARRLPEISEIEGEIISWTVYCADMKQWRKTDSFFDDFYTNFQLSKKIVVGTSTSWNEKKQAEWGKEAFLEAENGNSEAEVIYSRSFFAGSHVAAWHYKKTHPEVKWYAEFSDPVYMNVHNEVRKPTETYSGEDERFNSFYEEIERMVEESADIIIFTNENQRAYMMAHSPHPELNERILSNSIIRPHPMIRSDYCRLFKSSFHLPSDMINIGYFGAFYAARSAEDLLSVLDNEKVCLHVFYYNKAKLPEDLPPEKRRRVRFHDSLPYFEFLNLATKMDYLMVCDLTFPDPECVPFLPSKVSDYLATGTRILALTFGNSPLALSEDLRIIKVTKNRKNIINSLSKSRENPELKKTDLHIGSRIQAFNDLIQQKQAYDRLVWLTVPQYAGKTTETDSVFQEYIDRILLAWIDLPEYVRAEAIDLLINEFGTEAVIYGLAREFWYKRDAVAQGFVGANALAFQQRNKEKKLTVAFYGEGQEDCIKQITATLCNRISSMKNDEGNSQFKVILITDAYSDRDRILLSEDTDFACIPGARDHTGRKYNERFLAWQEIIERFEIDIVVSGMWLDDFTLWDALSVKSSRSHPAFIVRANNCCFLPYRYTNGVALENIYRYRIFDGVVTPSKSDLSWASMFNKHSKYIADPIPKINKDESAKHEKYTAIWGGNFSWEKRPLDVIKAFSLVVQEIPEAVLYMLGDGNTSLMYSITKAIEENGLESNVVLLGLLQDMDLYYQTASVFINTSEFEGFPTTFSKAMSNGLPVVTYNMPWLPFIEDGRGIITVEQEHWEELADKIIELLRDPDKAHELGAEGRKQIQVLANTMIEREWQDLFNEVNNGSVSETDGLDQSKNGFIVEYMTLFSQRGISSLNTQLQDTKKLKLSAEKEMAVQSAKLLETQKLLNTEQKEKDNLLRIRSYKAFKALSWLPDKFVDIKNSFALIKAPCAPKLSATSGKGISVIWEPVCGAKMYGLYRRTLDSNIWLSAGHTESNWFVDKKVSIGNTYCYMLRCLNSEGTKALSLASPEVLIIYLPAPEKPVLSPAFENGIKISWKPVNNANLYSVYRRTSEEEHWTAIIHTDATSIVNRKVTPGKTYYYMIRCLDPDGTSTVSPEGESASIRYLQTPEAPRLVQVPSGIEISWEAVYGAEMYSVYRRTPEEDRWTSIIHTGTTSVVNRKVTPGKTYCYMIRCLDKDGKTFTSSAGDSSSIVFEKE